MIRNIFVNPSDVLIVHVINDSDLPKNKRSFKEESLHYNPFHITIVNKNTVKMDVGIRPDIQFYIGTKHIKNI